MDGGDGSNALDRGPSAVDPGELLSVLRAGAARRSQPRANVSRPKVEYGSRTLGLDRNKLGPFLAQADLGSPRDHALASLLGLNGLRISEARVADIDDLDFERGHRTLKIVRKGGKRATIPLAPRGWMRQHPEATRRLISLEYELSKAHHHLAIQRDVAAGGPRPPRGLSRGLERPMPLAR